MSDGETKWWLTVPDREAELSKRIAAHHGMDPEQLGLGFDPPAMPVPNGYFTPVRVNDLVPLWTCYLSEVRLALAVVAGKPPPAGDEATEIVPNTPLSASDDWRKEIGLDGQADQT